MSGVHVLLRAPRANTHEYNRPIIISKEIKELHCIKCAFNSCFFLFSFSSECTLIQFHKKDKETKLRGYKIARDWHGEEYRMGK